MKPTDPTQARRQSIAKATAHENEAERQLARLAAERKVPLPPAPTKTFDPGDLEEISSVIREELARAKASSTPPGFSAHGPFGVRVSAKGRVAWLVAILLAVVVIAGLVIHKGF